MDLAALLVVVLIAAAAFGLVIAGMAVGVIFSNRRIKGSCGGLGSMPGGESPCMVCGGAPEKCDAADEPEPCADEAGCDLSACAGAPCGRRVEDESSVR